MLYTLLNTDLLRFFYAYLRGVLALVQDNVVLLIDHLTMYNTTIHRKMWLYVRVYNVLLEINL